MALSEPFSIDPEQGEVHRNGGLLIVRQPRVYQASFSSRRWSARPSTPITAAIRRCCCSPRRWRAWPTCRRCSRGWRRVGTLSIAHCVWRCRAQGVLLLALAAPALFINAVGGQNSTGTALFGGGLSLLRATAAARRRIAQTADLQAAAKAADPGCVTSGRRCAPPRVSRSP